MKAMIFDSESVRAILDGAKHMTRRVVKWQPNSISCVVTRAGHEYYDDAPLKYGKPKMHLRCPHPVDTIVYVKETWATLADNNICHSADDMIVYRADAPEWGEHYEGWRWKSPLHLREADSRIKLRITGVKVERLQDISEADVIAEGIPQEPGTCECDPDDVVDFVRTCGTCGKRFSYHRDDFARRWDKLNNKKPGCSWADNPWVWAYEFEVLEATHD